MPVASRTVTVTTTPTLLTSPATIAVVFDNDSTTATVFVGSSSVSTANGIRLGPQEKAVFDFSSSAKLFANGIYGVVATGTAVVRVMEFT